MVSQANWHSNLYFSFNIFQQKIPFYTLSMPICQSPFYGHTSYLKVLLMQLEIKIVKTPLHINTWDSFFQQMVVWIKIEDPRTKAPNSGYAWQSLYRQVDIASAWVAQQLLLQLDSIFMKQSVFESSEWIQSGKIQVRDYFHI